MARCQAGCHCTLHSDCGPCYALRLPPGQKKLVVEEDLAAVFVFKWRVPEKGNERSSSLGHEIGQEVSGRRGAHEQEVEARGSERCGQAGAGPVRG